jgi:hypothetical protein
MTAISPKRVEKEESKNALDQSNSKKVDTSLNNSGLNSSGLNSSSVKSKKQVSIYPLKTHNQAVEVKLLMANLTNNKEAIGNFRRYLRQHGPILHHNLQWGRKAKQGDQGRRSQSQLEGKFYV